MITVRGDVVEKRRADEGTVIDVELAIENQNGKVMMSAEASATLPSRVEVDDD